MGGFPVWTLWGMGGSVFCALIAILLAYLAQSQGFLHRYRLVGTRFSKSARRLTGLGLAALLLAVGFFLAGVPLITSQATGLNVSAAPAEVVVVTATPERLETTPSPDSPSAEAAATEQTEAENSDDSNDADIAASDNQSDSDSDTESAETGAFALPTVAENGAEPSTETETETETETGADEDTAALATASPSSPIDPDETETVAPTLTRTATPRATSRASETPTDIPSLTSTPTATPTTTPTITLTPTQVAEETVTVTLLGSLTWIYRVPGNQQLEIVYNQEQLILENGRAYQGGLEWREIRTLNGTLGWIESNLIKTATEIEADLIATETAPQDN